MTNLWRGAAAVAIISGALAGCASPHYPIRADQTPWPAPLSPPKPQYPITAAAAPQPAAAPTATAAPVEPSAPPTAAPVAKVESQSLPPATAATTPPNAATAPPTGATAPAASQAGAPTAAEPSAPAAQPSPAPSDPPGPSASSATAPTPPAAATGAPVAATTPAPPAADEPAMTPRMVVHDQASTPVAQPPPPAREAYAAPTPRRTFGEAEIAGEVVDAHGEVFENYEVRKGDHIDALARAFDTTREVLLSANHVRRPYVIHPGEIMKVPVAKAYVAESGDTLSGVARRFSVELGELAQLNHISERAALRPGQHVGLPSSMRDRGPLRGYAASSAYAAASPREPTPSSYVMPPTHPGLTPLYPSSPVTADRGAGYQTPPPPVASQAPAISEADISAAAKGRFVWPVRGDIVAHFGPTGVGRRNDGVDIKAAQGAAVMAAAPGEVVYAGDQVPGFGNLVLIKHADGWVTAYAHLDQVNVQMKDEVIQGQTVGTVGESGGATEPELHFEVRYAPTPADKARPVDPVLVLPQG